MRVLSAAGLLRALVALLVSAVVITTSVWLYHNRQRLFRPDVDLTGGTELVFALDGAPPPGGLDELVATLQRRFDPDGTLGIVVAVQDGHVSVEVPRTKRHDELVGFVRRVGSSGGRLELCLFAHAGDDAAAQTAAAAQLKGLAGAGRASPPPAPKNTAGEPAFPLTAPPGTPHRYRWARLAVSAEASAGLYKTLGGGGTGIDRPQVEQCLRTGEPFMPNQLPQGLVYAAQPAGAVDPAFYVLVREPAADVRVTADLVEQVRLLGGGRRGVIHLRFSHEGGRRLARLAGSGVSHGMRAPGDFRHLGVLVDGQVFAIHLVHAPLQRDLTLYIPTGPQQIEDVVAVLRGGALPVRLKPTPVRETPFDPRR